ncbi:glycosyltransferase 87 family protein [Anaerolineales bacterium HSG25]|nr:glycosyltransferase 87 family protein [Anaerolineales bacterium HSG25]
MSVLPRPSNRFSLIMTLFISSRLMILLAFPPENLIFYGDYKYFFDATDMSRLGYHPFIHYWYEYPPIFPYLNLVLYHLAGQIFKNYILFLAMFLLVVESGNLYLLYRLGVMVYNRAVALELAWVYTALFTPIFFWLGNFDALTTFFILLGLYAILRNKAKLLILAIGLGAMVKFLPLILLAPVARAKGLKQTAKYSGGVFLVCLMIFGPFLWLNPTMTVASLQAQANKSSYQTVWAILDGNDKTGNFGSLSDHFEPEKATQPLHNPSRIPPWLTLIPFAVLGLFIFTRPQRVQPKLDLILFTTITFVIFFLWSKGWSPQWQTILTPLLLLSFPAPRAVLLIIVLGFINFLEWPVILSRGLTPLMPLTILMRTAVLILIGVELYGKLTTTPHRR